MMKSDTIRYTTTLPISYINTLRDMVKIKAIPSVSFAIIEAMDAYLKSKKAAQFEALMKEAGQDEAFLARTYQCVEDFGWKPSPVGTCSDFTLF